MIPLRPSQACASVVLGGAPVGSRAARVTLLPPSPTREDVPAGRPVRLQPLCQRRPVSALRGLVHLWLPAGLPWPHLQAGRERVRPDPRALPQRRHLSQRGRLLPLRVPAHPHRPPLRAALRALQPLPLPERRHLPPHGGHHPRVRLPARYCCAPVSGACSPLLGGLGAQCGGLGPGRTGCGPLGGVGSGLE